MVHVLCSMFYVLCSMFYVLCSMFCVLCSICFGCLLCVVCCLLFAVCCLLTVVCGALVVVFSLCFVLCCLLFVVVRHPLLPTKYARQMSNKSIKHQNTSLKKRGSREGPGGSRWRSWDHFGHQGCPRSVPGAPGAEKVTKSSFVPHSFPISGSHP